MRRLSLIIAASLVAVMSAGAEAPAGAPETTAAPAPGLPPIPLSKPQRLATMAASTSTGAMVCRDPRLTGRSVSNIVGRLPGCGIFEPVKLTSIAGIKLTAPATLDCRTARTFANWLTGVADVEARRMLGARITKVWLMGTYSCRTRNNKPEARLSEHAVGRAVDVGGVWLGNGRKITVEQNWGKGSAGAFLRTIWKNACGPFRTVLGPNADRHHQDHLHFDTAYRKRSYCR